MKKLLYFSSGAGADAITFGSGVAKVKYVAGDGLNYASPSSATAVTTVGMDIVTGLNAGDDVIMTGYTGIAASSASNSIMDTDEVTGSDLSAVTLAENSVHIVRGTYSSAADTFTESSTGADSLFVYDGNVLAAANDYEAVVLVGTGAATFAVAAGTGGIIDIS